MINYDCEDSLSVKISKNILTVLIHQVIVVIPKN